MIWHLLIVWSHVPQFQPSDLKFWRYQQLYYCYKYYIHVLAHVVPVLSQELISTLREGNYACPREKVTFTCTIRGSQNLTTLVLVWSSDEYIGNPLRFSIEDMLGTTRMSMINGNVTATATLTSISNVGGIPILVSQLRITAKQASMVTCLSQTSGNTASTMFRISGMCIILVHIHKFCKLKQQIFSNSFKIVHI